MQMNIVKYIILVTLGLIFTAQACWAETRYVTDSFKITMRTGPSVQNKIIIMLRSGEPLEVMETQEEWSHVRAVNRKDDESEGWVMSRYLIERLPWEDQAKSLGRENAQLKEKLSRIEKEWRETGSKEKEVSSELRQKSQMLKELQKKYDDLKKGAANYIQLKKEYDTATSSLTSSNREVERLTEENEILSSSEWYRTMGMGALILLFGLMIGIFMGKFQKKQKSNILY